MIIRQSKVSSITRYLPVGSKGKPVICALRGADSFAGALNALGFSAPLVVGEQVLPTAVGPVSGFNSEGAIRVRKDLPKETAYRQIMWRWTEWHGRYDRVAREDVRSAPYKRYPRELIPPPSVELTVSANSEGVLFVIAPPITNESANHAAMTHVVNLFLELFGECELLQIDLNAFVSAKLVRVSWRILPPGRHPWAQVQQSIEAILRTQTATTQRTMEYRFEAVNRYGPSFIAIGQGGFAGYLILAFESKKLYVLESVFLDNATYVFRGDWERLSAMTKAEILSQNLHHARLIHSKNWAHQLRGLLG